jgi:hypothetical protein
MSQTDVIEMMQSSRSESEWNANCDKVKTAFEGYPEWWFTAIVASGVMSRTQLSWILTASVN